MRGKGYNLEEKENPVFSKEVHYLGYDKRYGLP